MARSLQKQLIRAQAQTFADWCAEVRDLAGKQSPADYLGDFCLARWMIHKQNAKRKIPTIFLALGGAYARTLRGAIPVTCKTAQR